MAHRPLLLANAAFQDIQDDEKDPRLRWLRIDCNSIVPNRAAAQCVVEKLKSTWLKERAESSPKSTGLFLDCTRLSAEVVEIFCDLFRLQNNNNLTALDLRFYQTAVGLRSPGYRLLTALHHNTSVTTLIIRKTNHPWKEQRFYKLIKDLLQHKTDYESLYFRECNWNRLRHSILPFLRRGYPSLRKLGFSGGLDDDYYFSIQLGRLVRALVKGNHHHRLEEFEIESKRLTSRQLRSFSDSLTRTAFPRLQNLNLGGNCYYVLNSAAITQRFVRQVVLSIDMTGLIKLRLEGHGDVIASRDDDIASSIQALVRGNHRSRLEELDLSGNSITPHGLQSLCALSPSRFPCLQKLNLSRNDMLLDDPMITQRFVREVVLAPETNLRILGLQSRNWDIDAGDVRIESFIQPFLDRSSRLEVLDLSHHMLTSQGLGSLCALTPSRFPCLQKLTLYYNWGLLDDPSITQRFVQEVLLVSGTSLKELNMSYCGMGAMGAEGYAIIIQSLEINRTLLRLDISDNCYGMHHEFRTKIIRDQLVASLPKMKGIQHLETIMVENDQDLIMSYRQNTSLLKVSDRFHLMPMQERRLGFSQERLLEERILDFSLLDILMRNEYLSRVDQLLGTVMPTATSSTGSWPNTATTIIPPRSLWPRVLAKVGQGSEGGSPVYKILQARLNWPESLIGGKHNQQTPVVTHASMDHNNDKEEEETFAALDHEQLVEMLRRKNEQIKEKDQKIAEQAGALLKHKDHMIANQAESIDKLASPDAIKRRNHS